MKSAFHAIQNSALWAAYGDALGFITELVDSDGVRRRIRSVRATNTIPWERYLGGKYGAKVELPAGCYSDDTQLRLATSRAIRGDGHFDVEVFAKIELPIWLSYSLGAGIGSKAAAESLKKQDVNWFSNFFTSNSKNYLDAGGDGAAMRIQPHVWSTPDVSKQDNMIRDVIRNSICTHGHPRGFLGSVFHALCLSHAINYSEIPDPTIWNDFILYFHKAIKIVQEDNEIGTFWLPTWEKRSKESISAACEKVIRESIEDVNKIKRFLDEKPAIAYYKSAEAIGALLKESRGSGIKTALLANANSWLFRNEGPTAAIEVSANVLNSDTDTISTMVGAIIGALAEAPTQTILDKDYIRHEAIRMHKISQCQNAESPQYPDLFKWVPPKAQADSIGYVGDRLALAGLSFLSAISKEYEEKRSSNFVWQWFSLEFGQTIISRRRVDPLALPTDNIPFKAEKKLSNTNEFIKEKKPMNSVQKGFWDNSGYQNTNDTSKESLTSIDELFENVLKSNFRPELIGEYILKFAEQSKGIENSIAFTAIVVKALKARIESKKTRDIKTINESRKRIEE